MPSLFSYINFFKTPIRLKLNRKEFYSSKLGELLSLAIIGILLFTFINNDVFYKRNPSTLKKTLDMKSYPSFNFDKRNFIFAVQLVDRLGQGYPIDPTIYNIYATYNNLNLSETDRTPKTESYTLEMVPCVNSSYANSEFQFISGNARGYCLPNPNFTIKGGLNELQIQTLTISLIPCLNYNENVNQCKTQEEISKFFVGKYVAYSYNSFNIDLEDFENPFKLNYLVNLKIIDPKIRRILDMNIEKVKLYTDGDYILEEKKLTENWSFGEDKYDFDFNSKISLFDLTFFSSNREQIYIRKYIKLQEAIGSLGGILNSLVICGLILLNLIPFKGFNLYLANKLYSFEGQIASLKNIIKKQEKQDSFSNIIKIEENSVLSPETSHRMQNYFVDSPKIKKQNNCEALGIHGGDYSVNILDTEDVIKSFKKKSIFNKKFTKKKSKKNMSQINNLQEKFTQEDEVSIAKRFSDYLQEKREKKKLKINTNDFLGKNNIVNLRKKLKLFRFAQEKMDEGLDICQILEKLQEIDKLKVLFFSIVISF